MQSEIKAVQTHCDILPTWVQVDSASLSSLLGCGAEGLMLTMMLCSLVSFFLIAILLVSHPVSSAFLERKTDNCSKLLDHLITITWNTSLVEHSCISKLLILCPYRKTCWTRLTSHITSQYVPVYTEFLAQHRRHISYCKRNYWFEAWGNTLDTSQFNWNPCQ